MKDDSNLAYSYSLEDSLFELREESFYEQSEAHDERMLEKMRTLVKEYVQLCLAQTSNEAKRDEYKIQFDQLRSQLRDSVLKEYSSFEFMEKLYFQEYSTKK